MPDTRYRCCAHCWPRCPRATEGHVVPCRYGVHCPGRMPIAEPETEG